MSNVIKTKISGNQIIGGSVTRSNLDPSIVSDIDTLKSNDTTQISQISQLQSDVAAEQSARVAADSALDVRLGVLEQDPTTKSYVDQKVADVVNSAPETLNTLKELADALGSDPEFATTVASNIGTVAANLASEVTRATEAEAALQGEIDAEELARAAADSALGVRLDVLEQDPTTKSYVDQKVADVVNSAPAVLDTLKELADALGSDPQFATTVANNIGTVSANLASEVTRATAAEAALQGEIDAEELARAAADSALDARVAKVEENLAFSNVTAFENAAAVFADAAPGIADPSLRDGWYFKNDVAGKKINWYFFDGQATNVSVANFSAYAVLTVDSLSSLPFLVVYTTPTGSGDATAWFKSSRVFNMPSGSAVVGKKYLVYFGQNPNVHTDLPRIQLVAGTTVGSFGSSERILTASIHSNSGASVNNAQFVVESLGVNTASFKQEVDLKIRVATQVALDAEASARSTSDANLQSQINALQAGSSSSTASLDARLTAAEGDIDSLETSLASEITRATSAESALDARLDVLEQDPTTKSYVDQKVAGLVDSAPAVLDTLKELADALGSDPQFATTVANNIGTVSANLASEVTRATAAEAALQGEIDAEELARAAADSALDTRVTALEVLKDAQTRYVSKNGNDTTGNGGEHAPFLTIKAALASITDASPTNRYVIKVKAGAYSETGVVGLKPNVFIVGENRYSVRIGAGSFAMDATFSANSSSDHRSGFASVTLLNACDFNWSTVTSAAGKLYFSDVAFSSTVSMYGHNNAIAQAQFESCQFFNTFTVSGINVGVHRNNIHFGNISLNQHPNGGMATILAADGGSCSGTVTLTATTNDFNRRCSMFAKSFYMEYLTVNGPSAYCDLTDNSVPRDVARVTKSNGGNIVYINTTAPIDTNSRNMGDVGKQYLYNFNYVNASTGTDLYVISMGTAYSADSSGKNINIEADSYGLNTDVNGGDINLKTAAVSGTGVRGKIKLDGKEIDVTGKNIVNIANGVNPGDAVNKSQLDALSASSGSDVSALTSRVTSAEGNISGLQTDLATETSERAAADSALDARLNVLEQDPTTKAYVDQKVADLVDSAPAVLDTLNELAAALGDDANFATTVSNNIGTVSANLASEVTRATAAEAALQGEIDAEELARAAADSALDSRIDALESVSWVVREVPVGVVDGVNAAFELAKTPKAGSEMVFLNGLLQEPGSSADYVISGKNITFASAPAVGWRVLVTYSTVE